MRPELLKSLVPRLSPQDELPHLSLGNEAIMSLTSVYKLIRGMKSCWTLKHRCPHVVSAKHFDHEGLRSM